MLALAALALPAYRHAPALHEVSVVGQDYAFTAPDTLPPGPTSFRFRNLGSVAHELVVARLKAGVTPAEAFAAEQRGADVAAFYDEGDGLLYAERGDSVDFRLRVDLLPGRRYVLVCTLEGGPHGKPHVMLGMFKAVAVSGGR